MRIDEIKVTPYPYDINIEEKRNATILTGDFYTRDESHVIVELHINSKEGTLSFSRDGSFKVTNDGDQFKILFTVVEIIKKLVPMAVDSDLITELVFSAATDEPSRVKLYKNKVAPLISSLLGGTWEGPSIESFGYEIEFTWISDEHESNYN